MSCPCPWKGESCCDTGTKKQREELATMIADKSGIYIRRKVWAPYNSGYTSKKFMGVFDKYLYSKLKVDVKISAPLHDYVKGKYFPLTRRDYKELAVVVGTRVAEEILKKYDGDK